MKGSKTALMLASMALMAGSSMYDHNQQRTVISGTRYVTPNWKRKVCKSCSTFKFCSKTNNPTSKACNQYKSKK